MLCLEQLQGDELDQQDAERASFGSVEAMRKQLRNWGAPDWITHGEQEAKKPKSARSASASPRPKSLGPDRELPPAGNATDLFRERLKALLESVELLEHMDEGLRGNYFVHTNVSTANVLLSREDWPTEVWERIRNTHGLNPDDKSFLDTNAHSRFPGGVSTSPSDIETTLIASYALADGDMGLLLTALRPDRESLETNALEEIRRCIEGSKAAGDKRDGLQVLARHLATLVRGGEVRPGRPSKLSKADHEFACTITSYRENGLTDQEIAHKESDRKKEDGSSYSVKDVTRLGDLGLSWP